MRVPVLPNPVDTWKGFSVILVGAWWWCTVTVLYIFMMVSVFPYLFHPNFLCVLFCEVICISLLSNNAFNLTFLTHWLFKGLCMVRRQAFCLIFDLQMFPSVPQFVFSESFGPRLCMRFVCGSVHTGNLKYLHGFHLELGLASLS